MVDVGTIKQGDFGLSSLLLSLSALSSCWRS